VKSGVLIAFVWLGFFHAFGLAQTVPADAYTQAASEFQQGALAQAEHTLRAAIASEPNRPDLLGLLAVVLDSKKEFEPAEQFHQRALKIAPDSAGLWNNLGNHYLARGMEKDAEAAFRRVLEIDARHSNANLQLARIDVAQNRGADALHHLEKLNPADQGDVPVQLLRARALHLTGQYNAALAIVDRLEREGTHGGAEDARLAFSIGVVLAEWKQYDRAETAFSRALENDPSNIDILRNLGLAALDARHFERAQRVFGMVIQQRPEDVESIANLARIHAAQGDTETAIVLLAKAHRLAPDRPGLLLALAKTYGEEGFFSSAADAYDVYLKLQPGDDSARRERGFAYCRFGRMQTALPDLNWYVTQHPGDPVGQFELGLCQTAGDASEALQHLNEALRLEPGFLPARQARGQLMQREGKWEEALPDLKSVVEHEPHSPMALMLLGRNYLELERPAEAITYLRRAQELAPDHAGILMWLHRALRRLGQDQEAATVLKRLKAAPPDPAPEKAQAQIFDYLGLDPTQQRERFRRNLMSAIAARPEAPELKIQLGVLQLDEGKTEEALANFRDALALSPGVRVLKEAATVLEEHGLYGLAREFQARVVDNDPSVDNRLDLAAITFHSAGPEASLAEMDKIPVPNRNGDFYLLKAQILDALGRFESAVELLNVGFHNAPKRADLYSWASLFLIKHGRDQEALDLLEQATTIVQDDPHLLLTKAIALELRRKSEEADSLLTQIQLRWPEWGRSYLIHGIIQATHRNAEEALKSLQIAAALGERSSSLYYYLAEVTRSARPAESETTKQAIAEALRLDPEDAWSHALAGKIALDDDEPGKAAKELTEAIRLRPNLAEAHYSLSIAYMKLGRKDEASREREILRTLRQQNPRPEEDDSGIREKLFASEPRR
jgi:tetratricopeptide (TPR) repeat protein